MLPSGSGSCPGLSLPGVLGVVVRHDPVWLWPCPSWGMQKMVTDVTKRPIFSSFQEVLKMCGFQSPGSGLT